MLVAIAFALGLALGWNKARRMGGDRLDRLQYAAVYAVILSVLTVLALVILGNLLTGP